MTTTPTAGELIRALKRYYPETYDLNVVVNDYRRNAQLKNWYVAAKYLLEELKNAEEQ